jgi:hypothetical protein
MPNLKLTNLASCKAYFTLIATKHKEIDIFRWGEVDVVRKDSRVLEGRLLWVKPYDGAKYSKEDNIIKSKTLEVRYMKPAESELQDHIEAAFTEVEDVIEQIIAKMLLDKRGYMNEDNEWEMISFKVDGLESENFEMKLGSTRYIGTELKIPFQDNTNLQYDATKWEE